MPLAFIRRTHAAAARLLAGCMVCALVICGVAAARVAVLGTNHVHLRAAQAEAAMAGWQDFRRADHLAGGNATRAHSHASLQRHRHDAGDHSVVSLDADAGAALAGEASNAPGAPVIALLAAGARIDDPLRAATTMRWPAAAARGVERIEAGRLERPPRG